MEFGEFIKKQRFNKRCSAEDVGVKAGISGSYILAIEGDRRNPSTATACKILDALGLTYVQQGPLAIFVDDYTFTFQSVAQGRGKESVEEEWFEGQEIHLQVPMTAEQQIRLEVLHAAIQSMEKQDTEYPIIERARYFEQYVKNGAFEKNA